MDAIQIGAAVAGNLATAGRRPAPPPTGDASAVRQTEAPRVYRAPAPQPVAPPMPELSEAGRKAIEEAVARIRRYVQESHASLEFAVDHGSSDVVLRITDSVTKELIRQVPSEEVLAISRALDRFTGLLLAGKA